MFTALDMKKKFFERHANISASYITKTLKSDMDLHPEKKTKRYTAFSEGGLSETKKAGKPFIYKNPYFGKDIADSNSSVNEEDDLPF